MTLARLPNPVNYRAKLIGEILATLMRGRSCTIIGVGSSGKSNVARHLVRRDALRLHLKDAADGTACVLVDFQHYAENDATGLHCLLIESLLKAALAVDAPSPLVSSVSELRAILKEAHDAGDNAKRTRYCLSESVRIVYSHGLQRLFFVFDDFDNGLKRAPAAALNSLRGLRDDYKDEGRLAYVVVMRREMSFVRPETQDYEDFYELVNKPVFAVGAFDDADAFEMIRSLSGGTPRLSLLDQRWLISLSGGHPGLLKQLFFASDQGKIPFNSTNPDTILNAVYSRNDVQAECEMIWDSLADDERAALRDIVTGRPANPPTVARLRFKTLVREEPSGKRDIFSRVFARYVAEQTETPSTPKTVAPAESANSTLNTAPNPTAMTVPPATFPNMAVVSLSPTTRTVLIDGRSIGPLDEVEYHLFERLYQRRSNAVPGRELLEIVFTRGRNISKRFPGPPDNQRDRYMEELVKRINLPHRTYITGDEHGAFRFVENQT